MNGKPNVLLASLLGEETSMKTFPLAALHMLPALASQDTLCQVRAACFLYECMNAPWPLPTNNLNFQDRLNAIVNCYYFWSQIGDW